MKLNQVIAIEKGVKSRAISRIDELYKDIQKPALFDGLSRTYQPKDEAGEMLPSESKVVQKRVTDVLGAVRLEGANPDCHHHPVRLGRCTGATQACPGPNQRDPGRHLQAGQLQIADPASNPYPSSSVASPPAPELQNLPRSS